MEAKSTETAAKYRNLGNSSFRSKQFFNALLFYNQSLCHAPLGSVDEAFVYANRSAVFLENNLYEKCLDNIQLAEKVNHPKLDVLAARREKCLEMMKLGEDRQFEGHKFELSYPAHEKFPFMVECLEFRKDKDGKGHMFTNQELKAGEIIIFAEPLSPIINSTNFYQRCSFCIKDNMFDLLSCPGCNTTMYCSDECRTTAYQRYHRYECGMIEGHEELRNFFVALSLFDDDIEGLQKFLTDNAEKKHFLLDFDFSNVSPIEIQKQHLLAYLSLGYQKPNIAFMDAIKKAERTLKDHEKIKHLWPTHKSFIRSFLKRQVECNNWAISGRSISAFCLKVGGHGQTYNDTPDNAAVDNDVAYSETPLFECFTHSCASRVRIITVDAKSIYYVVHPLKAGDEIFDCKASNSFESITKAQRMSEVKLRLGYKCRCEACENDYELINDLPNRPSLMSTTVAKERDEIELLNMMPAERVLKKIQLYSMLQEDNDENYPDYNSVILQFLLTVYMYICVLVSHRCSSLKS